MTYLYTYASVINHDMHTNVTVSGWWFYALSGPKARYSGREYKSFILIHSADDEGDGKKTKIDRT